MKTSSTKRLYMLILGGLFCVFSSPGLALTPTEAAKLLAGDGAAGDNFGWSVSVDGDTAVIGAQYDDDKGSASGSAYVFVRSAGVWTQQAKLTASDGTDEDIFGYSVSVDGDTAVIGASEDDDKGYRSGSAYVFVRSAGVWTQQAKLTASDGTDEDYFGWSVSVDGDTAVIGALYGDNNGFQFGSVYVFVRSGTSWSEQTKLAASDGAFQDFFGSFVSVDGDTAVIGAAGDDNGGSAYVFVRSASVWTQQAKLTASDGTTNDDFFGRFVSVDGDTAVIGNHLDDDKGGNSGSAYVFVRSGTSWSEQAKLTASDGAANDWFGRFVSVDGDTAVIAAHGNDAKGANSGSAYVFVRSGTSWSEQAKLTASDGAANNWFGVSVSVDGDTAVIGAYGNDAKGANSGSAYVFSLVTDADGDGVADDDDLCPKTTTGDGVDVNGCSDLQVDQDLDGYCGPDAPSDGPSICTDVDNCPNVYNPLQTQTGNNVGGDFGDACVDPNANISDKSDVSPDVEVGTNTTINQGVTIGPEVVLGDDVTVNKDATIGEGTEVGAGTTINQGAVIGSDTVIGDNVTIGSNCVIGSAVTIDNNTVIGQGCIVDDGVAIGANVTIGKDATIQVDVPAGTSIPKDTVWGP